MTENEHDQVTVPLRSTVNLTVTTSAFKAGAPGHGLAAFGENIPESDPWAYAPFIFSGSDVDEISEALDEWRGNLRFGIWLAIALGIIFGIVAGMFLQSGNWITAGIALAVAIAACKLVINQASGKHI